MLAQDIAARLCHDLAGLAGTLAAAIGMAAEEEEPRAAAEALSMANQTASALSRRLGLLRAAFAGGEAPDWPSLAQAEPRLALAALAQLPLPPAMAQAVLAVALDLAGVAPASQPVSAGIEGEGVRLTAPGANLARLQQEGARGAGLRLAAALGTAVRLEGQSAYLCLAGPRAG